MTDQPFFESWDEAIEACASVIEADQELPGGYIASKRRRRVIRTHPRALVP